MHTELGASNFKVRISFCRIGISRGKPGKNDNYVYYLQSTMLMQSANKLFRILQKSIKSCRIKFNQAEERCRGNFWENEHLYHRDYYSFQLRWRWSGLNCTGLRPFNKSRMDIYSLKKKEVSDYIFYQFWSVTWNDYQVPPDTFLRSILNISLSTFKLSWGWLSLFYSFILGEEIQ